MGGPVKKQPRPITCVDITPGWRLEVVQLPDGRYQAQLANPKRGEMMRARAMTAEGALAHMARLFDLERSHPDIYAAWPVRVE